jgi:hypothetical protein
MRFMAEDPEQFGDALDEYKKQLDRLRAQFDFLVRHSRDFQNVVLNMNANPNYPGYTEEDDKMAKAFIEKFSFQAGF